MERKAHNSLYEAALQVQLDESSRERKAETREKGGYKYGAGRHPIGGGDDESGTGRSNPVYARRQDRKSKEAQSSRKKELTRKKLYPKGEKKTFADKLFNHVEYDEVDSMVLEYFDNYFGDNLNEDTSNEEIMQAVYDLIDLTEAVLEATALEVDESVKGKAKTALKTAWETVPFRGDIQNKLRDTRLGKFAKKKFSKTKSMFDIAQDLPAGGADKEIDKMWDRSIEAARKKKQK